MHTNSLVTIITITITSLTMKYHFHQPRIQSTDDNRAYLKLAPAIRSITIITSKATHTIITTIMLLGLTSRRRLFRPRYRPKFMMYSLSSRKRLNDQGSTLDRSCMRQGQNCQSPTHHWMINSVMLRNRNGCHALMSILSTVLLL